MTTSSNKIYIIEYGFRDQNKGKLIFFPVESFVKGISSDPVFSKNYYCFFDYSKSTSGRGATLYLEYILEHYVK